jgi:hypothetical protein
MELYLVEHDSFRDKSVAGSHMLEGVEDLLPSPVLLVPELKAILITHNNYTYIYSVQLNLYRIHSIRQFVSQILNCLPYSILHLDAQSM